MMKNQRPLILPDGSRNRNPQERCLRSTLSKHNREDEYKNSHRYKRTKQNNVPVEVKEEAEFYSRGDDWYKEEKAPSEISTAGPSSRVISGYPGHPYSWDSSLEDHKNPQDYQGEDLFDIKVEVKDEGEEMYSLAHRPKSNRQFKEEGFSAEISPEEHYMRTNWEKQPILSPEGDEDNGTFDSSEETPNPLSVHPVYHNADLSSDPSTSGRSFPDHSPPTTHVTSQRGVFKRQAALIGRRSARLAGSSQKRILTLDALSSEDEEDEAGPPRKLGGGLRNIRFSHEENCVLVHKVTRNWASLYGAQCQQISFAQKKYLWQGVVSAVNAVCHYARTVHHCKKRLSDIKRYLRTKLAAHKKYPRGSGSGTLVDLRLTEYEEELLMVVGEDVMTGLEGAHLSTDRIEEIEYICSPEQQCPAPSLIEEEESRKEDLSETPSVYTHEETTREAQHLKMGQIPPSQRFSDGFKADNWPIVVDTTPSSDTQHISSNHRESLGVNSLEPPRLPSTNQTTSTGTYEESIISTLSNVASKFERLNAQSRKETNRSHRLLNNIHTDLLLLKEELKDHREQQTAQSEKMLKLLEESNALKKMKLQLMRERIDLMRGHVPSTSAMTLETPAPSPLKEATTPLLPAQASNQPTESNQSSD